MAVKSYFEEVELMSIYLSMESAWNHLYKIRDEFHNKNLKLLF